ncbi:hypothetical protein NEOLEDRAFT_349104 [Neolentinus lepideus HHB14362 ss-1]|uniref:Zn(2)-C6 fungal-type domain-containing protein n=1 Tax=Neolentinus lepideus HHB14362 ss-1 TaxID=1314782 RepID=A0A165SRD3_9AGAM|nr:hypothetical protein NEOLEDRAFT_349104 [Neolentinus lepideus HHB14362 ss-1]
MSEEQTAEKPSTSVLKERRFKLSRACDRCRRRRIKCDEGHPCQACLNSNSACTFEEPGKRSHPHKSKRTATLEDRMHHLETLIQAIPPSVFAAAMASSSSQAPPSDPRNSPHTSFASSTHTYPAGVPPNAFPLTNPSTHFMRGRSGSRQSSPSDTLRNLLGNGTQPNPRASITSTADDLAEETARMSLSPSYLYLDDEGYTRWQGETSGMPLLDLLVDRSATATKREEREASPQVSWSSDRRDHITTGNWFPDRTPRRTDINPEMLWKLITSVISPDLMDSLVQCYLSTSYYLLPFLHVPTFLADYGNPQKWGEPGFAAFIVAICCLSSRHIDDPRVRADPNDGVSAGTQWFELFARLRTLPTADRPTLYTIQAVLIAGVYAVGLGKLSRAFALLSEAITLSIDAGLHRSADAYDIFDSVEEEVRKRTFWAVYLWDKQACAHFGRPPMIRLRDCDAAMPSKVDDEYITRDGIGAQPPEIEPRMSAFVSILQMFIVLESVLDAPPSHKLTEQCSFMARATSILSGFRRPRDMRDEETLLDDVCRNTPSHWAHSVETMASDDVIRVTQAERLHCVEQFIRMLIHRHRFSERVAERTYNGSEEEQSGEELEAMRAAHACALQIVSAHLHVATKGLMTYYGVHVIHQLTQAGRTLVAIMVNSHHDSMRPLVAPALEALRSCVGLLRRFSGRYVCGMRSGDLMEEFCRLTQIPLDSPARSGEGANSTRPPWMKPVRKKTPSVVRSNGSSSDTASQHNSPEDFSSEMFLDGVSASPAPITRRPSDPSIPMSPNDFMALLNDGGLDMASLFSSAPTDFMSQGMMAESPAANVVYASPISPSLNGNGLLSVFPP